MDKDGNMKVGKKEKKVFDKKKWREQKYSVKHKVERWNEKRKKVLENQYKKELKKEGLAHNVESTFRNQNKINRVSRIKEAQLDYDRKKEEKKQKAEEVKEIREQKRQKMLAYKAKKTERFKKLSHMTRRGQPVMHGRLQLLKEQIENLVGKK